MALHHFAPGEKVRLDSLAESAGGRATALVKTDRFEAAQLRLGAGEEIARHSVPGYATVHCLAGRVVLETGEEIEMAAGDWLYLDRGQAHSVRAAEDSRLLLTILFE
jgi:quercetin dioxygenase-like cupin family protein